MKKQFTVINVKGNLDEKVAVGTQIRVKHQQNNSYDAKALEVLSVEGDRIGFVTNGNLAIETSPGGELFDMMNAVHQLGGCTCVVTGYSDVAIGSEKQLIRKALVIEPLLDSSPESVEVSKVEKKVKKSKSNLFTVIDVKSKLTDKFQVDDFIIVSHDNENQFDKNYLVAKSLDGKKAGVIGNTKLAPGTESNVVLHDKMKKKGKLAGVVCQVVRHDELRLLNRTPFGVLVVKPIFTKKFEDVLIESKPAFAVLNAGQDLDVLAPVGTVLNVIHDTIRLPEEKSLDVHLVSNGQRIGIIDASGIASFAESNEYLFELMKAKKQFQGFECVVTGHFEVGIGQPNKRKALIVEPVQA